MNNIKIETFQQNLLSLINNSSLSAGVVKLILENTLFQIEPIYQQSIENEIKQQQQKKQEEEKIQDN